SVPSKLYGIMAAARPALFVGPTACEPAQTILDADCGIVIDLNTERAGERVCEVLHRWRWNPAERERLGTNGRRAFECEYEASVNCARIANVISQNWQKPSTNGARDRQTSL
ncbi:MAG: hypothetical protein ACREXY_28050, partial [Gammaproteobacteria bacterium]